MDRGRVIRFTMHSNAGATHSNGSAARSSPSEGASEPTATATATPAEPKPPRLHIISSSSNGAHHRHSQEEVAPKPKQVRYRECQKNHAANMGGHALDGCGEFLPSGKEGTIEALVCAACSCHRNFHRREVEGEYACACSKSKSHSTLLTGPSTPSLLSLPSSSHPHMVMPLNPPLLSHSDERYGHAAGCSSRKKRFRTKFTPEQKRRMTYFAESVEWKISRQDGAVVQAFCDEVGVDRTVLKVWMHNNKNNVTKKQTDDEELGQKYGSSPEYS